MFDQPVLLDCVIPVFQDTEVRDINSTAYHLYAVLKRGQSITGKNKSYKCLRVKCSE